MHTLTQYQSLPQPAPAHTDEPLCAALQRAQAAHQLLMPGTVVVVGVSGGADSVCLLHLLLRHATQWKLQIHVAHLDHNLRPAAAADADFVADLATRSGVPFHGQRLQPGELTTHSGNVEAAARAARYRFLAQVATSVGATHIAVAHNADDQAETVLMHLLRGSGLAGLAGMRYRAPLDPAYQTLTAASLTVVRPLLGVPRTQILHYLNAHDVPWREDPTNQDRTLTRNWLRHEILPQLVVHNPNLPVTLARTAEIFAAEADRATVYNRAAFTAALAEPLECEPQRVVLRRDVLAGQDIATQRGVLRLAWEALGQAAEQLTFDHVEALRQRLLVGTQNAGPSPVVGGIAWSVSTDRVSLHGEAVLPFVPPHPFLDAQWCSTVQSVALPVPGVYALPGWQLTAATYALTDLSTGWRANPDPWQVYLDHAQVAAPHLTTPQTGQDFAPLGMGSQRKSVGDLFTDRKIHPMLRAGWPLIQDASSGEIVWVCGIQPAHGARITEQTRQVLHLRWQKRERS